MSPLNKWWVLCAASLSCVTFRGSCSSDEREDGQQPELLIFNELCGLKKDPGPCKAIKDRFFFNIDTGQCEHFEYGGCSGNANNFPTVEACEEACVVTAEKSPCHLPAATGPCRGMMMRYFYDSADQKCTEFSYGGCLGNANNFMTEEACQARCSSADKPTNVPDDGAKSEPQVQPKPSKHHHCHHGEMAEFCLSPIDRGSCDDSLKRFAYNPKTKRCQMFLYGGCGGNKNNFTHRRYCIRKCIKRNSGTNMIRMKKKNMANLLFSSS
ncbi:carboxypeptidase inhibitor SmCI-like [Neosynchiropus ocellatus]